MSGFDIRLEVAPRTYQGNDLRAEINLIGGWIGSEQAGARDTGGGAVEFGGGMGHAQERNREITHISHFGYRTANLNEFLKIQLLQGREGQCSSIGAALSRRIHLLVQSGPVQSGISQRAWQAAWWRKEADFSGRRRRMAHRLPPSSSWTCKLAVNRQFMCADRELRTDTSPVRWMSLAISRCRSF